MVQIKENKALVSGMVKAIVQDPVSADYNRVTIVVRDVNAIDGFTNMFDARKGEKASILIKQDVDTGEITPGTVMDFEVKAASPLEYFGLPIR